MTLEEAIAAGRISPEWAEQRAKQWGRDSAMYANRVLGEFHASDEDSVIPLAWVEAAIERWHAWVDTGRPEVDGRRLLGVDVARSGGDSTVLCHRRGAAARTRASRAPGLLLRGAGITPNSSARARLLPRLYGPVPGTWCLVIAALETHDREDTMRTTARVQGALGEEEGAAAVVDSIGVGGGVVDRLRELGAPVLAYTGSAGTKLRTRDREFGFKNTRSAALWKLRELLDPAFGAELALPPDDLMVADLTTPTWDITTGVPPKIKVEPKEDVAARLGRSPDRGDAVAMAMYAEYLAASKLHAPGGQRDTKLSKAASRYGRPTTQGLPHMKAGLGR
ncbi:hypothetical protein ACIQCF_26110 [Streptomyces sp. NPDC088353]|uniref:hypothetical protein n=1 Tax=unclassified Streptomyces TaxID=2593676 RepID=UPI003684F725